MLNGIALLLACQLAGEVIARFFGMPVPGPVVGMVLLLALLMIRGGPPEGLRTAADGLLRHLALLYVPAGVGLMVHFHLIAADWLAIAAGLVGSTVAALVVTALTMQWLSGRRRPAPEADHDL